MLTSDLSQNYPTLAGILSFAYIFLMLAILWVFGRIGDNINKIRKVLELEMTRRRESQ